MYSEMQKPPRAECIARDYRRIYEGVQYTAPLVRTIPKHGRNQPCPCGSGLKYKKCCIDKELNHE